MLKKPMEWNSAAKELKRHVNAKVPFFIRGFVDKTITRAAEMIAVEGGAAEVGVDHVIRAYLANTPKAMLGLMGKALKEKGIDPSAYGFTGKEEASSFPIGEPMSREEIDEFLRQAVTGRLGTCAGGEALRRPPFLRLPPWQGLLSLVFLRG